MVPSSIQATPMTAKNTAPITQAMIAAGPARLTAARVANNHPDPT